MNESLTYNLRNCNIDSYVAVMGLCSGDKPERKRQKFMNILYHQRDQATEKTEDY
jgi:hypothetical protein